MSDLNFLVSLPAGRTAPLYFLSGFPLPGRGRLGASYAFQKQKTQLGALPLAFTCDNCHSLLESQSLIHCCIAVRAFVLTV
jgi:hypothetical protein